MIGNHLQPYDPISHMLLSNLSASMQKGGSNLLHDLEYFFVYLFEQPNVLIGLNVINDYLINSCCVCREFLTFNAF